MKSPFHICGNSFPIKKHSYKNFKSIMYMYNHLNDFNRVVYNDTFKNKLLHWQISHTAYFDTIKLKGKFSSGKEGALASQF